MQLISLSIYLGLSLVVILATLFSSRRWIYFPFAILVFFIASCADYWIARLQMEPICKNEAGESIDHRPNGVDGIYIDPSFKVCIDACTYSSLRFNELNRPYFIYDFIETNIGYEDIEPFLRSLERNRSKFAPKIDDEFLIDQPGIYRFEFINRDEIQECASLDGFKPNSLEFLNTTPLKDYCVVINRIDRVSAQFGLFAERFLRTPAFRGDVIRSGYIFRDMRVGVDVATRRKFHWEGRPLNPFLRPMLSKSFQCGLLFSPRSSTVGIEEIFVP